MGQDGTIQKTMKKFATKQDRNYVIMDVRGNLIKEEREEFLKSFPSEKFRKVAHVQIGEPDSEFKKHTLEVTLKKKQAASDAAFKTKQTAEKIKREAEKKKKAAEKAKKKAEKEKEAAKKKAEDAKKEGDSKEKEEEKEEPEEEEEEEKEEEVMEEDPPKVELTEEEKKLWFIKPTVPDLDSYTNNTSFAKYSIPSKEDGFDDVKYGWDKSAKSQAYLKKWIVEKKNNTVVEDLKPSDWFKKHQSTFDRTAKQWFFKAKDYKTEQAKKSADLEKKKREAKAAAEKAKADEAKAKEGKDGEAKEDAAAKPMEVDAVEEEV